MAWLLGFSLWADVNWRWQKRVEDESSLFSSPMQIQWKGFIQSNWWRVGLAHFEMSYVNSGIGNSCPPEVDPVSFRLEFYDFQAGRAFTLQKLSGFAWVGAGYSEFVLLTTHYNPPGYYPTSGRGITYSLGLDLGVAPKGWNLKPLGSVTYRWIPNWFPGHECHHQWEIGLGFEFKVYEP